MPPYETGSGFTSGNGFNSGNGHCTSSNCAIPSGSGLKTSYEVDVSLDGASFSEATEGTWPANGKLQGVSFPAVQARYVRLIAKAVNSGAAAATEIEVGGPQALKLATPTPADWGH